MMTEALPLSDVSFCRSMGHCHITVWSFAILDLEFDPAMTCQDLHFTVEMVASWMQGMSLVDGRKFSLLPHLCLKAFPIKPPMSSMTWCKKRQLSASSMDRIVICLPFFGSKICVSLNQQQQQLRPSQLIINQGFRQVRGASCFSQSGCIIYVIEDRLASSLLPLEYSRPHRILYRPAMMTWYHGCYSIMASYHTQMRLPQT